LRGRERQREKKQEARRQREEVLQEMSPEERAREQQSEAASRKEAHAQKVAHQLKLEAAHNNGLRIAIECCFVEMANDRELRSLSRQLAFCIAANKRAPKPGSLHFTSFSGPLREFSVAKMRSDQWLAHQYQASALEIFSKKDIIVLSPDAEDPLEEIDPSKVYLIGGIVDRTVKKHITAGFAEEEDLTARRLPLQEHLGRQAVLNVNHVAEAILAVHGGETWSEVLERIVPERKLKQPNERRKDRLELATTTGRLGGGGEGEGQTKSIPIPN